MFFLKNSSNDIRTFKDENAGQGFVTFVWMLKVSVNYRQLLNLGSAARRRHQRSQWLFLESFVQKVFETNFYFS